MPLNYSEGAYLFACKFLRAVTEGVGDFPFAGATIRNCELHLAA